MFQFFIALFLFWGALGNPLCAQEENSPLDIPSEERAVSEEFVEESNGEEQKNLGQENSEEGSSEQVNSEQVNSEQVNSEQEEEEPRVDEFYKSPGFRLFPKIKLTDSSTLSIRNILRNEISYDSNVFLTDERRIEDTIYAVDWETQLKYKHKKLELNLSGGFRYEDFFGDQSLDQILPRVLFDLKYKSDSMYILVKEAISRNSVVNAIDLNERRDIITNNAQAVFGYGYKRVLFELASVHNYTDFRDIDGDVETYGQTLLLGYALNRRIYATFDYTWDYIDYREAAFIVEENRDQDDSFGQSFALGGRFRLANNLKGSVRAGIHLREGDLFPFFRTTLNWLVDPRLKVELGASIQNVPTFFGDFQTLTAGSVKIDYLINPLLAVSYTSSISYSHPEDGENSTSYRNKMIFTYRLYKGIDFELFGEADFLRTDQQNNVLGNDFNVFRAGASINLIF